MCHRYPPPAVTGRAPLVSAPSCFASHFQHDVIIFHTDRKGLRHIRAFNQRGARSDRYSELPRAHPRRIAPRLAGAQVELPAVPWAADDLAAARIAIAARLARLDEAGQAPLVQATALVRALVAEREKLAFDVEDHDLPALDIDQPACTGWKFAQARDDVLRHEFVLKPLPRAGHRWPVRCRTECGRAACPEYRQA